MTSGTSVNIHRVTLECQVPATLAGADRIAARLSSIARGSLQEALADCLRPLESGGDRVVLIKRLEFELDVDLLADERQLARAWSGKIKKALLGAMTAEPTAGTLVFADPPAYLGAALLDMVRGRARRLWYYRRFDGLWALPLSAALCTALLDDPPCSLAALARLSGPDLAELCGALTTADAQRVLATLFPAPASAVLGAAQAATFARAVAGTHELALGLDDLPARRPLLLATLALREQPGLGPGVIALCAQCFSLLSSLSHHHRDRFESVVAALAHNPPGRLTSWLTAEQIAALLPLFHGEAAAVQCLAQPLLASRKARNTADPSAEQNRFTRFGNALLLLPGVRRLPLDSLDRWPGLQGLSAQVLLRWLVLCACQGGDRFHAAAGDPLLRDLCGMAPGIGLAEVSQWLDEQLTPRRAALLFAHLRRAHGPAEKDRRHYRWRRDDRRVSLRGESVKGCWFHLHIGPDAGGEGPVAEDCEPLHQAMADFASLWPGDSLDFSDLARAVLTVLAQYTLKSFAYRLPGFANAAVAYLLRNFLSMSATLILEEQGIRASLSRVPMSVILNMTGISRGSVQLPDFDPRPVRLLEAD